MCVNREPPTEAPKTNKKKKKTRGGVRTWRALKGEERQEHFPAHTSLFIYFFKYVFSVVPEPDILDVKLLVREQQNWSWEGVGVLFTSEWFILADMKVRIWDWGLKERSPTHTWTTVSRLH